MIIFMWEIVNKIQLNGAIMLLAGEQDAVKVKLICCLSTQRSSLQLSLCCKAGTEGEEFQDSGKPPKFHKEHGLEKNY